ncbi:15237_t:CDS:2, partial [Rhizophagus irregularis]
MASSHDFSTLSWDEVLSKLREVEDLCAKFRKGFRYPPVDDHPSHDDPIIDNLPSLPLAIWASKHEADPNIILDLCTPSTRRTNRLCPSQRTPKFLCKRVSSMISPASFKCAQKIKTKLSFTRLVLSPSTIRLLVPPLSCPSEPKSPFQNTFPDSSLITPRISALEDIADYDHNVPSPVLSLNSTPAGFLLATSTSAPLLHDNVQCSSYTFTIRTILDGWIRPARNIGSNRLYSIRRGNCYFLLDSTPDSDNCYSIHTNSPLLSTTDPFQFISDPLLTQRVTSLARWSSSHRNNRRTCTFIQFQYHQSCFYLGLYFGCPFCKTPAAYVMSQFRHACHIHDRKLVHTPSPPPSPPFTLPCNRMSKRHADGFYKDVTSRRLGVSYHKSYAFHHVLEDDSVRHKDLLSDRSKFSRHVVHPDLLDSSMWMATKDHAIVIPPTSYNLTISTTDYSIVQNIRNLVSSHPDVSFCLKERSPHSSVAFVSSKFTGSIQKLQAIVLNPSSVVASHFITDKPMSGPFVGLNCPVIDYQNFKTLGFSRSIIDMVRRILSNSASIYVPSHNFLWLLISKHNTSSVSKKYLRDAIQSIITKSASSSTFSHLWNSDTRFSFKLGRVKPCDILMLLDVCAPWFDSHPYPASSDFRTPWDLPADF